VRAERLGRCDDAGCIAPVYRGTQCRKHYRIALRERAQKCSVRDCGQPQLSLGLCNTHYLRQRKYGTPGEAAPRRRKNGEGHIGNGYLTVHSPGHPNARQGGRIQQHRLVMSQILDRPLLSTEEVHHRNGDRLDNRPENLELWSTSQPYGQRVADKLKWAHEIIALYGDIFDQGECA